MAKKGGKLTKWQEIQIGFTYYSKKYKQNVKVISSDGDKLTHTVQINVDGVKTNETVPVNDLTKEKKN